MKNEFINKYSISKTLRFSLIPIGKTAENFDSKLLLIEDEKRAEEYIKVKGYMDRYYRSFNERILNSFCLNGVREYAELYFRPSRSENEMKEMSIRESEMRKQIMLRRILEKSFHFHWQKI